MNKLINLFSLISLKLTVSLVISNNPCNKISQHTCKKMVQYTISSILFDKPQQKIPKLAVTTVIRIVFVNCPRKQAITMAYAVVFILLFLVEKDPEDYCEVYASFNVRNTKSSRSSYKQVRVCTANQLSYEVLLNP